MDIMLGYHRIFPTLADAERAVFRYNKSGFRNSKNSELYFEANREARPSDYAALFHLASEIDNIKLIFDFGGNIENLFYCYLQYLSFNKDLVWTVYVLPRDGQHVATAVDGWHAKNLEFADRWEEASGSDLLIASGSLHYVDKPLPQLVAELPKRPRHILINRTPLTHKRSVAVAHDVGHSIEACMLYNHDAMVRDFQRIGYILIDSWQAPELNLDMPGNADYSVSAYSGLWFKLVS